jgi:3-methyladenine DNA glycosylase AlkC
MAEALKDRYFQRHFFERLINEITPHYPEFQEKEFYLSLFDNEWRDKPLKEMLMHSASTLRMYLPVDYLQTLALLKKICHKFGDFDAMIFPDVVRQFGMDYYDESMQALELFTQFSTAEFAIRPYILAEPLKTMQQMLRWSTHANAHVRRLASEGCRSRLPWAMALPDFKEDPSLILPILENLKSDSSLYVRKSVANNFNDITKDHADVVIEIFKKWHKQANSDTHWIMKHALRGLLKAGHPAALALMGFEPVTVGVSNLKVDSPTVNIGEKMSFSFDLKNDGKQSAELMVDYIVHFRKANGKTAPKVFKLKTLNLASDEQIEMTKSHNFKLINTRKYYLGAHAIQIQVNGEQLASIDFELAGEAGAPANIPI